MRTVATIGIILVLGIAVFYGFWRLEGSKKADDGPAYRRGGGFTWRAIILPALITLFVGYLAVGLVIGPLVLSPSDDCATYLRATEDTRIDFITDHTEEEGDAATDSQARFIEGLLTASCEAQEERDFGGVGDIGDAVIDIQESTPLVP